MNQEQIAKYWDAKAEALQVNPAATMKDVILRSLEIEAIGSRLKPDDELLDVGGGNAYAGIRWAPHCRRVLVVDFSENMIAAAHKAIGSEHPKVSAARGSVLDLGTYAGRFSATSCVRCLINLATEADQLAAVDQLSRTLQPGGRLFLIEGLEEGFAAMNQARRAMGLPAIELDWHNRLFKRDTLETKLRETLVIEERIDFGEYYFLSRVVHPLAVAPEEPAFDGRLNHVARQIWQKGAVRGRFADLSTLVLYVCRKPAG